MWEGADFTPILMSDVVDNAKVKKFYRKAMLVLASLSFIFISFVESTS